MALTGSRAQAYGARSRRTRVIRRKLDCLKSNLQRRNRPAHRNEDIQGDEWAA